MSVHEEWEDVTTERARGSEWESRLDVTPAFAVEITVSRSSRVDSCDYELVLTTVVERDDGGGRHISDHPVAGYADREEAREAFRTLQSVVSDVVAERDDLPNPDRRLAHDVVPRFLEEHADRDVCEALYDPGLAG